MDSRQGLRCELLPLLLLLLPLLLLPLPLLLQRDGCAKVSPQNLRETTPGGICMDLGVFPGPRSKSRPGDFSPRCSH